MSTCWQLVNHDSTRVTCHCVFVDFHPQKTQFCQRHCAIWFQLKVPLSPHMKLFKQNSPGAHWIIYKNNFLLRKKWRFSRAVGIYLPWPVFSPTSCFPSALTEGVQPHCQSELARCTLQPVRKDPPHDDCDAERLGRSALRCFASFPDMCWTAFAAWRSCCISCRPHLKRSVHQFRLMQFASVKTKWHVKARALACSQHSEFTTAASATPHPAAFLSR